MRFYIDKNRFRRVQSLPEAKKAALEGCLSLIRYPHDDKS